ncbi:hypothetical protein F8A10_15025 [Paracoccus kondratievae]|uniref:hypothetical protein n=1 Tax=Paracoccus kondratievae TaxID=135740 RepID=UPI00126680AB|nr:hypothetical protein [Paracoccus kondratievae]QFQ88763.1 hypothetical protein F8A10_15025 [Paracoccus kondratievae]
MKPILTADATFPGKTAALLTALALLSTPLHAQEPAETLAMELNGAVSTAEGACQLTIVLANRLTQGLRRAAWQVAVFDKDGVVKGLPVLDFGTLPPGKTRIAQFALPGGDCDALSRIVINDVAECTADDGTDHRADCLTGLATSNRSDIEFGL